MIRKFKIFENNFNFGYLMLTDSSDLSMLTGVDMSFIKFIKERIGIVVDTYKNHYFLVEYQNIPKYYKKYFGGDDKNRLTIINNKFNGRFFMGRYIQTENFLYAKTKEELKQKLLISKEVDKYNL